MSDLITIPAFAKFNWTLRVLGRRPDGYHEIATALQTISLHDRLSFSHSPDGEISFRCDDPSLPSDRSNLVSRAAHALKTQFAVAAGARINLEKRIPIGSGLGGGSSDAAITLLGLMRLWNLESKRDEIIALAAGIGADVPFFLHGGTALGTGTGTTIEMLPDAPEQSLLVLMPNVSVSTKAAYDSLNAPALTTVNGDTILSSSREVSDFDLSNPDRLQNDFQAVVMRSHEEIERARIALLNAGARTVMLAGSGGSIFGVFENSEAQKRALQAVKLEAGWRLFPCKTIGREEYAREVGQTFLSVP
ncbi:MAG: 4-diphosphocytidyl-2-C-methyl-D-erythritol kinase [Blastocatellia bacterium]|nr:4-diphosphocytidyl-2-C-methyl-D-erythritol kinase [Blastocatellia bacterium]